jgi:predicted MFS family arabinose efflux permease
MKISSVFNYLAFLLSAYFNATNVQKISIPVLVRGAARYTVRQAKPAIGDVAHPTWRASAVGVYRLWRDLGYAVGAIIAGVIADRFGLSAALWFVAMLTFVSGVIVLLRMRERGENDGDA